MYLFSCLPLTPLLSLAIKAFEGWLQKSGFFLEKLSLLLPQREQADLWLTALQGASKDVSKSAVCPQSPSACCWGIKSSISPFSFIQNREKEVNLSQSSSLSPPPPKPGRVSSSKSFRTSKIRFSLASLLAQITWGNWAKHYEMWDFQTGSFYFR